jgi:adenylylsulfate kinase
VKEAFAIWLTGLPASGKTSIARELQRLLSEKNIHIVHLESDQLRTELTPSATYSVEERDWFYRTIGVIARILTQNGLHALIDATGNKRSYRDSVRAMIPRFFEVYVRCPLDVCIARDPKGIYQNAAPDGNVPGLQASYQEPTSPELVVDCEKTKPEEAALLIFQKLTASDWL